MILIALPTIEGREEALQDAIDAFQRTTTVEHFISVAHDRPSCGQGWLDAVDGSSVLLEDEFDYVFLASDDQLPEPGWHEPLTEAVDRGFLPCCMILNSDGTIQSAGGDLSAPENVRKDFAADWTPVGFSPFPFMGREQWDQIGMLPVQQFSDVWVSYRGRQLGYETVLRPRSRIVHTYHETGRERGQQRRDDDERLVLDALGIGDWSMADPNTRDVTFEDLLRARDQIRKSGGRSLPSNYPIEPC